MTPTTNTDTIISNTRKSAFFQFEEFDKEKIQWSRWQNRLESAFAINETHEEKKVHLLLHHIGYTTYNTLCDKLAPAEPARKTYDEICKTLAEIFEPKPLEIVENYRFHLSRQQDHQSVDEFLIELKKIATHCNFGTYLETALRNQLVFGLKSKGMRNRLLEKTDLTLENTLKTARAMELSEKGNAEMTHNLKDVGYVSHNEKRNRLKYTNKTKQAKTPENKSTKSCYRCGGPHLSRQCTEKNLYCTECRIAGHTKKVCIKSKRKQKDRTEANYAEHRAVEEICHLAETKAKHKYREKFWITIQINSSFIDCEIDSGALVAIMSKIDYNKKIGHIEDHQLHEPDIDLVSYTGNNIKVFGFVYVNIASKGKNHELRLYIVESKRHPLLGREWLNVLPLDWNKVFREKQTLSKIDAQISLQTLRQKYPRVFDTTSMGKLTGLKARIQLKPNVVPIFKKARRPAFSMRARIESEIDDLVQNGVLKKVDTSEWATPIVPVPKSNERVRICGDYKITVNPSIHIDEHPLPSIEELFSQMSGGKKFTKIYLTKAYLQMEVHEEDQKILTLSTHKGLYQPTRLMYGIATGPAIWQREIENILKDIDGVTVFLDDIKITAPDDTLHIQRLETVLQRLEKHNMRANFSKCEFMADSITYCGYKIDRHGIHKMQEKMDAIQQMKEPTTKDEVRSFIGLVNYYGRFFKNLSTVLYPLNNLLKDKVPFIWDAKCKIAFNIVKQTIASTDHLVHYNPKLSLVLATDASPVGVGAVLSHVYPDGTERPIQFASQTLTATQQRYSQFDREAYAIVYGVKKFYQYVYSRHFILQCDNKPVTQIFSPQKGLPILSATRMQHYAIFLSSFDFEIRYRKSVEYNNADALSRLPQAEPVATISEIDIIELNFIQNMLVTVKELARSIEDDKVVSKLVHGLKMGEAVAKEHRFGIDQQEFALQEGCLLRGTRVYIPQPLRKSILEELHQAHLK